MSRHLLLIKVYDESHTHTQKKIITIIIIIIIIIINTYTNLNTIIKTIF